LQFSPLAVCTSVVVEKCRLFFENFGPFCFCVVGIYRDSFGCLGFVEDARNYVAWGGE